MKMKLLSPAGDIESLKMAIFNGADEVYLGIKNFNARNIEGFSLETLKDAVKFAHLYGVRVFLTVNILFKDEEIKSALDLIVDAYNLGVDAFIVQDLGLASLIYKYYPQIELHASTQMGIHNLEGVREIEKLKFKRVVLARETPLEEIRRIKENSDIEIEYFCQGALCVSFSGNCYMSSYLFHASGNRGKCKQLCRLPYEFCHRKKVLKKGYLLSAKDLNMLNRLKDLEQAGVNSLKIEGRARRPYYVAVATKTYRNALDGKLEENELKLAFNRGYVEGYFNGNSKIISNLQNHIGIEIGEVKKTTFGKKFNEIFIQSKQKISPKSTLKFIRDGKEIATISAYDITSEKDVARITSTTKVKMGDKVFLINDYEKEKAETDRIKKLPVEIDFVAKENEPLFAKCKIRGRSYEFYGEVLENAKSAPISEKDVTDCFLKSDFFEPKMTFKIGNVFLLKSKLNAFRRDIYNSIYEQMTTFMSAHLQKREIEQAKTVGEIKNVQFVEGVDSELTGEVVVFDPETYIENAILSFKDKVERVSKKFVLNLPNFALKEDILFIKNMVEKNKIPIMVQNLYALSFETQKIVGGGMNVFNNYTVNYLGLPYLSSEDKDETMPYMTLRHCPMKEHLGANCNACPYNSDFSYRLESGKTFRLKRKKLTSCTFYLTK